MRAGRTHSPHRYPPAAGPSPTAPGHAVSGSAQKKTSGTVRPASTNPEPAAVWVVASTADATAIATRAHRLREVKAPWPTWPVGILATPVSPSPLWRMPWAFALLDIAGVASEVWVEDTTTAQPVSMSRQSPGRFREEEIAASAMTHSSSSGTSFMRRNRPLPSRLESASASRRHTRDW